MNELCQWCQTIHNSSAPIMRSHKRYVKTRENGGIAPVKQHNASTYVNWHCRCLVCQKANTTAVVARAKVRRQRHKLLIKDAHES